MLRILLANVLYVKRSNTLLRSHTGYSAYEIIGPSLVGYSHGFHHKFATFKRVHDCLRCGRPLFEICPFWAIANSSHYFTGG